jgi:hypothetical protein
LEVALFVARRANKIGEIPFHQSTIQLMMIEFNPLSRAATALDFPSSTSPLTKRGFLQFPILHLINKPASSPTLPTWDGNAHLVYQAGASRLLSVSFSFCKPV